MSKEKRNINLESDKKLKDNPFSVSDGYFASLQENILNAADASESDIEFNLHLKQNKMQVPTDYFQSLSQKIESRIEHSKKIEQPETKIIDLPNRNRLRWVGLAASILLIASLYFGLPSKSAESDELALISDDLLIEFLEEETEFGEDMIASVTDIDQILDDIYLDETGNLGIMYEDNPELDYDFEYYE